MRKQEIFTENCRQIASLSSSSSCGPLTLTSTGASQEKFSAPLVRHQSTFVDMKKIPIGDKSLDSIVREVCKSFGVTMDGFFTPAYTSVTAALPGQHEENDSECTGLTHATFLPTYQAPANRDKNILMLAIFEGSSISPQLTYFDSLRVPANKCLSGQEMRMIETTTPHQLADAQRLTSNKHFIVFVEYDFHPDETKTTKVGGHTTTTFVARPYNSHIMKLSVTTLADDGQTITAEENGYRMLNNIEVFCVQPFIVNTQGVVLSVTEREAIQQTMMDYAAKNTASAEQEAFSFNAFCHLTDRFLEPYHLDARRSAIFEHALLHMADWPEEEVRDITFGHFSNRDHYLHFSDMPVDAEEKAQQCPYIDFESAFTETERDQFFERVSARLGRSFFHKTTQLFMPNDTMQTLSSVYRLASHTSIEHLSRLTKADYFEIKNSERYDFTINLVAAAKALPLIYEEMKIVLSDPRNLRAHQLYMQEIQPEIMLTGLDNIIDELIGKNATKRLYLVGKTLLTLVNHGVEPKRFALHLGKGYVARMLEAHFYFSTNIGDPQVVVDRLNTAFASTPPARIVATDVTLADTEEKYHVIALDRDLLTSTEFLLRFQQALEYLLDKHPLYMDQFRPASLLLPEKCEPVHVHFASLYKIALEEMTLTAYASAKPDTKLALCEALKHFGLIATSEKATAADRQEERRQVKIAERNFKNELPDSELRLFKDNEGKIIKAAMVDLGAALPRSGK